MAQVEASHEEALSQLNAGRTEETNRKEVEIAELRAQVEQSQVGEARCSLQKLTNAQIAKLQSDGKTSRLSGSKPERSPLQN